MASLLDRIYNAARPPKGWTKLVIALHNEEALNRTNSWLAERKRIQASNHSRMRAAQNLIEESIKRNNDFDAYKHLLQTAIANLQEAEKEAFHR